MWQASALFKKRAPPRLVTSRPSLKSDAAEVHASISRSRDTSKVSAVVLAAVTAITRYGASCLRQLVLVPSCPSAGCEEECISLPLSLVVARPSIRHVLINTCTGDAGYVCNATSASFSCLDVDSSAFTNRCQHTHTCADKK